MPRTTGSDVGSLRIPNVALAADLPEIMESSDKLGLMAIGKTWTVCLTQDYDGLETALGHWVRASKCCQTPTATMIGGRLVTQWVVATAD